MCAWKCLKTPRNCLRSFGNLSCAFYTAQLNFLAGRWLHRIVATLTPSRGNFCAAMPLRMRPKSSASSFLFPGDPLFLSFWGVASPGESVGRSAPSSLTQQARATKGFSDRLLACTSMHAQRSGWVRVVVLRSGERGVGGELLLAEALLRRGERLLLELRLQVRARVRVLGVRVCLAP